MRLPKTLRTERSQHIFEAAWIVVLLLILPALPLGKYGGGVAMLAASVVGLVVYWVLYGERLRGRGQLKWMGLALVIGALVSLALAVAW